MCRVTHYNLVYLVNGNKTILFKLQKDKLLFAFKSDVLITFLVNKNKSENLKENLNFHIDKIKKIYVKSTVQGTYQKKNYYIFKCILSEYLENSKLDSC